MNRKVSVAVLEETLQRSVDGLSSLSNTLDQILAVVAEHGDAALRKQVDAIMAGRQPVRMSFADLDCGDAVH